MWRRKGSLEGIPASMYAHMHGLVRRRGDELDARLCAQYDRERAASPVTRRLVGGVVRLA